MVRAAYFGTDQPDPLFIQTQDNQSSVNPLSDTDVWTQMMQNAGFPNFVFPSAEILQGMTEEQREDLIHQLSLGAATDGEFEALRDLAQILGLADPYPQAAEQERAEAGMAGQRLKLRSQPLPGATARVRELLGRQGHSLQDIDEMMNRQSVRGFYRGRRAFRRLYEAPPERPSDPVDIGGVGNWLNYDLYGSESVLPQPNLRFVPRRSNQP